MSTPDSQLTPLNVRGAAGRLAGWTAGSSNSQLLPILFIHPINLQGVCWADVAGAFASERFCVMPDMRGHGGSDPAGPFGVEHWAQDLLSTLDHLSIERAHMIGGSLGGALAVYLAATQPQRVASIASVGGSMKIEGEGLEEAIELFRAHGPHKVFENFLPQISLAPGTAREIVQRTLELANPNDADTVSEVWKATLAGDVRSHAPAVGCPATVICGELDLTCPREQAQEMATALGVELIVMSGVGHMPMLEAPRALTQLLASHLEETC